MFMGYLPLKIGVQLSEHYTTEATFRVELKDGVQSRDSWAPVQQHRIRKCEVRLFYANHEEVHNKSMTQPDFRHENSGAELRALRRSLVRVAHSKRNREGCCYNEAEQSGGETPDEEDLHSKRLVLPDGAKEN
ncbi:TMV resistance protein N-like [Pyrus ussuriensis x Pyrus communis]|uniref:TMV resistance protein N-like n=1 Tax=Pyrus ussuriensis x Pyrus communis TaxID=2448454 RepID=A0A5N5F6B1_9ROSA|nr:TMV resistance protein N-like [Pyrus ussuriensis x Pyrus communis]